MVESYQVCVATHLSPDWKAIDGLTALAAVSDPYGRPVTHLSLACTDRLQLVNALVDLHAANVAILSVELIRETEEVC